jgi:hypothetical protein
LVLSFFTKLIAILSCLDFKKNWTKGFPYQNKFIKLFLLKQAFFA